MYRLGDLIEGDGLVGKLGMGALAGVGRVFVKTEKAEPLGEFHHRTGLGLLGGSSLTHLLLGPDDLLGIVAAGTEIYGNVEATIVDAQGALKNLKIQVRHAFLDPLDGLWGGHYFILVVSHLFKGV